MPILKNKNYLPYALSNFFNNNERWQARALNSSQYHDLEQRVEQYKKRVAGVGTRRKANSCRSNTK